MMTNKINYNKIPEFERDFKRLGKRFKTLDKDFELMKRMLLETHYLEGQPVSPRALVDIEGFCGENYKSKKVRRFTCASLKGKGGNSGIRVIFVYEKTEDTHKITFVEIYFKGEKENEDRERLAKFLKELG